MPVTSDDRIAFVIDTEARLDGIKAARSQVTGLKADTQGLGVTSIAATREMSMLNAIHEEAVGKVGAHSLGLNRLERALSSSAGHALGMNRVLELLGTTSLKFGVGDIYTIAIVGGLYAITYAFERLTESSSKAIEVSDKLVESYLKEARISALGLGGKFKADIEDIGKGADAAAKRVGFLIAAQIALRGSGLDILLGHFAEGYSEKVAAAKPASDQAAKDRDKDIEKAKDESANKAEAAFEKRLARALAQGRLAEHAAFEAYGREEKAADEHTAALAKIAEDQVTAMGFPQIAQALAINAAHDQRLVEIEDMRVSSDAKLLLMQDADALQLAELADLNRKIADENARADAEENRRQDAARRKREAADRQMSNLIISTEKKMAADLVDARRSFGKRLLAAALEPEIAWLQAKAEAQFVESAANFLIQNWKGGAEHAAAGIAYEAGAGVLANMAGGGGGGGGRGGGGGGAGSSSTFEPSGSNVGGQGSVIVQLYSMNPYGAEMIQEVKYELERADILKRGPIKIAPTHQLRAG